MIVGNVTCLSGIVVFDKHSLEKLAQVLQGCVEHFQSDVFLTNQTGAIIHNQVNLILHELFSRRVLTREFVRVFHQIHQIGESVGEHAAKTNANEVWRLLWVQITIEWICKTTSNSAFVLTEDG